MIEFCQARAAQPIFATCRTATTAMYLQETSVRWSRKTRTPRTTACSENASGTSISLAPRCVACAGHSRQCLVAGVHERIAVVGRRDERLLDGARAQPADQVPHRAGLVVGARGAGSAA